MWAGEKLDFPIRVFSRFLRRFKLDEYDKKKTHTTPAN